MQTAEGYTNVANELRDRIVALIPTQPQILNLESCWDLFKVPGFDCSDLGPSLAQAAWAFSAAKQQWYAEHPNGA